MKLTRLKHKLLSLDLTWVSLTVLTLTNTDYVTGNKEFLNVIVLPYFHKIKFHVLSIVFVSKVFSLQTNKFSFTTLTNLINDHNTWRIYRFICECSISYFVLKTIKFILKVHLNYVRRPGCDKFTIAKHYWNSNHEFNYPKSKIIQTFNSVLNIDFYEILY